MKIKKTNECEILSYQENGATTLNAFLIECGFSKRVNCGGNNIYSCKFSTKLENGSEWIVPVEFAQSEKIIDEILDILTPKNMDFYDKDGFKELFIERIEKYRKTVNAM